MHESAHVAMAVVFSRPVEWAAINRGGHLPGEVKGEARVPVRDRVEGSQLAIALSGYLVDERPGWPPAFEDAVDEPLEALSSVLTALRCTRTQYEQAAALTKAIVATQTFQTLMAAVARMLAVVPRIEHEDIAKLRAIYLPEEELCST